MIQHHWRGQSVHADLRLETGETDKLIGWTMADMVAGIVTEPVETLETARKWSKDGSAFKIDFAAGRFKDRETGTGHVVPAQLRAFPKEPSPREWLEVEGLTEPYPAAGATAQFRGVFVIEDQGVIEYGVQRDDVHEYFLDGKLKGRLLFRKLSRDAFKSDDELAKLLPPSDAGEGETQDRDFWVAIQSIDQTPLVLANSSVESGWMPPVGISALPKAIRDGIPNEFQYWNAHEDDQARQMRDGLAEAGKQGEVKIDFEPP